MTATADAFDWTARNGEAALLVTRNLAAWWYNENSMTDHSQGILHGRMQVITTWMTGKGDPLVMQGYVNEINFYMRRNNERLYAQKRGM